MADDDDVEVKKDPTTGWLEHENQSGYACKYFVKFGKDEIVLTSDSVSNPEHRSVEVYDAKTFLPVRRRTYWGEALKYEVKSSSGTAGKTSRVSVGKATLSTQMLVDRGKAIGILQRKDPVDYELGTYGDVAVENYRKLDKAIAALPDSMEVDEIRRRFDNAAAKIGYGEPTEIALGRS